MPKDQVHDTHDAERPDNSDCEVVQYHPCRGAHRWVEAVCYFRLGDRPFFPRVFDHQGMVYNGHDVVNPRPKTSRRCRHRYKNQRFILDIVLTSDKIT